MLNTVGNWALFVETALILFLIYCPGVNIAIGTRQLAFCHFLIPGFSFSICVFLFDEMRKVWVRTGTEKKEGQR